MKFKDAKYDLNGRELRFTDADGCLLYVGINDNRRRFKVIIETRAKDECGYMVGMSRHQLRKFAKAILKETEK